MSDWVDVDADWAYWINPETFRMPRVKEQVPPGALVLAKEREDADGRSVVVTNFSVAGADGLEELDGKKAANEHLIEQMLAYMRTTGKYPPNTVIKKTYKNGNVDLSYVPGDYDTFTLRLTEAVVGEDPAGFLDGLQRHVEEAGSDELADDWMIEPAKSGRASCRACRNKIAKGELRLGQPSEYEGNVTYRWYHLHCGIGKVADASGLEGFDALDEDQQAEALGATDF